MMRGSISLTEKTKQQRKKTGSKPEIKYDKKTKTDQDKIMNFSSSLKTNSTAVDLRTLKNTAHKYRAEVRTYGQTFDQINETSDLKAVLSFCKQYYGKEDSYAVLLFVDNEQVKYISYLNLMKEYFPEL